jgi:NitT/TauT family transport system substrate-binding protein
MRTFFTLLLPVLLIIQSVPSTTLALERHIHARAGGSSAQQLPLIVAKDLGLFEKYGLNLELLEIRGGSLLMQALIGQSVNSADVGAQAPIRAILSGANVVITGGLLNKTLYKFVTRKEIRTPSDLRGKKIGIVNFGGANEFNILMALKAWGMPPDSVSLLPSGGSLARLAAMEVEGGLDATIIPYGEAAMAAKKGFNILADLSELMEESPEKVFIADRSFMAKKRDNAKRFFQAVSESIYVLRTQPELKGKIVPIIGKWLRINAKLAEEAYDVHHQIFAFPPRVGRKGLQDVLEIIQREPRRAKDDLKLSRFVNESTLDELEKEGFFKNLTEKISQK